MRETNENWENTVLQIVKKQPSAKKKNNEKLYLISKISTDSPPVPKDKYRNMLLLLLMFLLVVLVGEKNKWQYQIFRKTLPRSYDHCLWTISFWFLSPCVVRKPECLYWIKKFLWRIIIHFKDDFYICLTPVLVPHWMHGPWPRQHGKYEWTYITWLQYSIWSLTTSSRLHKIDLVETDIDHEDS